MSNEVRQQEVQHLSLMEVPDEVFSSENCFRGEAVIPKAIDKLVAAQDLKPGDVLSHYKT